MDRFLHYEKLIMATCKSGGQIENTIYHLGGLGVHKVGNIKTDIGQVVCDGVDWIHLARESSGGLL
jgi:hypothetical protein